MHLISPVLEQYIEEHTTPEAELLKQLDRETHLKHTMPQMLSGHVQGQFLSMIASMQQPKTILEIGTYTGYSAICLAKGLAPNGQLHSIEIDEEKAQIIQQYWEKAGITDKAQLHIGNAADIIPKLKDQIDLVFIDADKVRYAQYWDLVKEKMAVGGLILADNVLWSGKVVDQAAQDKSTEALRVFNTKVQADPAFENVILPLRDGIMLARKCDA